MGQVFSMVRDGLVSLASRMGTERDKAASVFYTQPILTDEQIIAAYRGSWLPRKIVDIPALDSCRRWRNWQAASDQIGLIDAEERRLNLRGKVLEASTKARLFGGAALFIGSEHADPALPFEMERIGKGGLRHLTVLTRRQLAAADIDGDPASEWYGKPKFYTLTGANGMQVTIHPSRLVIFKGAMTPNEELGGLGNHAWGESVLAATFDAIKNADSTAANIASLVFEAKIDIIKVPQFSANIGNQAYEDAVLRRYALANTIKGVNGTLILDSEEEYDSKSAPLSGLTDILMAFLQIVAGAADIPVTRLLGQSPAGMNATGTADMKKSDDVTRISGCFGHQSRSCHRWSFWRHFAWPLQAPIYHTRDRCIADLRRTCRHLSDGAGAFLSACYQLALAAEGCRSHECHGFRRRHMRHVDRRSGF